MTKRSNALAARLRALLTRPTMIEVRDIGASRAQFIDDERQEIHLTLTLEDGLQVRLAMHPRLAAKLITEVSTSYHAINPPLRLGGNAAQWMGMGGS